MRTGLERQVLFWRACSLILHLSNIKRDLLLPRPGERNVVLGTDGVVIC